MKKRMKMILALVLIPLLLLAATGASAYVKDAEPPVPVSEPPVQTVKAEIPAKSADELALEAALAKKYYGHTLQELGFSNQLALEVSEMTAEEAEAFVTVYINLTYDFNGAYTEDRIMQEIRIQYKGLLDGSWAKESVELYKVRAGYVMRVRDKSAEESAAIWDEFNAYAGGFDSVEEYLEWKEAWDASLIPTPEQLAAEAAAEAAWQEQMKKENGGYMGELNP